MERKELFDKYQKRLDWYKKYNKSFLWCFELGFSNDEPNPYLDFSQMFNRNKFNAFNEGRMYRNKLLALTPQTKLYE